MRDDVAGCASCLPTQRIDPIIGPRAEKSCPTIVGIVAPLSQTVARYGACTERATKRRNPLEIRRLSHERVHPVRPHRSPVVAARHRARDRAPHAPARGSSLWTALTIARVDPSRQFYGGRRDRDRHGRGTGTGRIGEAEGGRSPLSPNIDLRWSREAGGRTVCDVGDECPCRVGAGRTTYGNPTADLPRAARRADEEASRGRSGIARTKRRRADGEAGKSGR